MDQKPPRLSLGWAFARWKARRGGEDDNLAERLAVSAEVLAALAASPWPETERGMWELCRAHGVDLELLQDILWEATCR